MFPCLLFELTGIYCPGCGGTRALKALLRGELLLSFHENPAVLLIFIGCMLYLVERIRSKYVKKVVLLPKSERFWMLLLTLWLVWASLRNWIPVLQPFT